MCISRSASARVGASSSACSFSTSRLSIGTEQVDQPQGIIMVQHQSRHFRRSLWLRERDSLLRQVEHGSQQRFDLVSTVFP